MYREVLETLVEWKEKQNRQVLLVEGAKGVGKSYVLKDFGEGCFDNVAILDLKKESYLKDYFSAGIKKDRLVSMIEMTSGSKDIDNTLIVIENIDEAGKLYENLEMIREEFSEKYVAVTFSKREDNVLENNGFSPENFDIVTVMPMSFREFLGILNRTDLCEKIENHAKRKLDEKALEELKNYIRKYIYIGGMPSVVRTYVDTGDMEQVEKAKDKLMDEFVMEIRKISDAPFRKKVLQVWQSVPVQLKKENKKFQYGVVKLTARAREYGDCVQWLIDNKYIHKIYRLKDIKTPVEKNTDYKSFEIFVTDVGMMAYMQELQWNDIEEADVETLCGGALIEQLVFTELTANKNIGELYYWISEATARVAFLFEDSGQIIPIEINLKENMKAQSIKVYKAKFKPQMYISITDNTVSLKEGVLKLPVFALWNL